MATLLIGLSNPKNQQLLVDLLSGHYPIQCPDDLHQGLATDFDLCILDGVMLHRYREQVSLRRQFEEPRFLPILAVMSRQQLAQTSKVQLHELIDEVLFYPIDQQEIVFRIESLIRARRLSMELFQLLEQERLLEQQLQAANEALQQSVVQDSLTGLANRRAFDDTLNYELERARRSRSALVLVLCDVDYFKKYNDTYGHLRGDYCLQQIAEILQTSVRRPPDLAARYGGEEFALILPDTSPQGACQVVQRVQASIWQACILHHRSPIRPYVTMSFGISCLTPDIEDDAEALIQLADQALYQAKAEGRDRIVQLVNPSCQSDQPQPESQMSRQAG